LESFAFPEQRTHLVGELDLRSELLEDDGGGVAGEADAPLLATRFYRVL
jgi:hypothetical protein